MKRYPITTEDERAINEHGQREGAPQTQLTPEEADKLKAARKRKNKARREQHQAMKDLGLVRVRGALGGIYYE